MVGVIDKWMGFRGTSRSLLQSSECWWRRVDDGHYVGCVAAPTLGESGGKFPCTSYIMHQLSGVHTC